MILRTYQNSFFPQRNLAIIAQALLIVALVPMLAFLSLKLNVLLVLSATATFLLLRRPWLVWPALAFALPFASSIKLASLSLADVGLAAALMLWFIDGVRQRKLRLAWSPVQTALSLYIGALLVSMLGAENLGEATSEVVKWVEVLVLIMLIRQMVSARQAPWLVLALIGGGVAQSLLGLYQFTYQIGPDWFIILGRFMRASGSFNQPNPFAGYLGLILPVVVSLFLWVLAQLRQRPAIRWRLWMGTLLLGGSMLLMGAALLASWSRGGWLGAAAAMAIVVTLRSRKSIAAASLLTLVMLCALIIGSLLPTGLLRNQSAGDFIELHSGNLAPESISARFTDVSDFLGLRADGLEMALQEPVTDDNFAIIERLAHWSAALRMWSQAPWLGVGPGNYATHYPRIIQQEVYLARWQEPLGHAHNIYLNILAESGLVGLASYLVFWVVLLSWLWGKWRTIPHKDHPLSGSRWPTTIGWNRALALGVIGVIAHLSVHNLVDNLLVQGNYLVIGFWIAVLNTQGETFCSSPKCGPLPTHNPKN